MIIEYDNNKIRLVCEDLKQAKRKYPDKIAKRLHKVINFIEVSKSLQDIINYSPLNFHCLKADRIGQYAIDIGSRRDGYRLIVYFKENKEDVFNKSLEITNIFVKEMGNHYE